MQNASRSRMLLSELLRPPKSHTASAPAPVPGGLAGSQSPSCPAHVPSALCSLWSDSLRHSGRWCRLSTLSNFKFGWIPSSAASGRW